MLDYHFCHFYQCVNQEYTPTHRVIVPGSYSWQTVTEKSEPPPGSAMAVAKHLLSSILTQFADRRLFLYLFAHDYGKMADTVFQGIATSLADDDGDVPSDQGSEKAPEDRLYQFSAIKYFISVCGKVHVHTLTDAHVHMPIHTHTHTRMQYHLSISSKMSVTSPSSTLQSTWRSYKNKLHLLPLVQLRLYLSHETSLYGMDSARS